ncbi:desulfoferrodoxin [Candidatus Micrarchaeota archaeon]|nr:desulfoferrodoxin [Candidatus Micrarchaeota archaeon]
MTELKQVYKCSVCGNIVEVLHAGVGQLVCCGQPMDLMVEKTTDVGLEKHVPVIEKTKNGVKVTVGSTLHPMEPAHFIEWVELIAGNVVYRTHLQPGERPEAEFCVDAEKLVARAYCNVHGLWRSA